MKIYILFICLFLFNCSFKDKNNYSINQFRDLAIESSLAKSDQFLLQESGIFTHYQQSNVNWLDGDNVVKSYSYSKRNLGPLSYLPLLSFLLPRNYQNYEIIITMKNGSIANIQSFEGLATLESESNCNEAIFSCVKKLK